MAKSKQTTPVVGGVDTHKDLHVAAVVDDNDQVLGTQSFATTRQGYKLMLAWMRSFVAILCGEFKFWLVTLFCQGSVPAASIIM